MAAVLSGNRNFEGRINPQVRANYLASPPLVVAYALAGRMDIDLANEPLGTDPAGNPVYPARHLAHRRGSAPDRAQRREAARCSRRSTARSSTATPAWQGMPVPTGDIYAWDENSTYIKKPPYFDDMADPKPPLEDLGGMRVLALLGDSITTDHISPAGSIPKDSPAGRYLIVARRGAQGLQLLRRAPRQSRSDGARHARQHPPAQPAGAGHGGRLDRAPARTASRCPSTTPPCSTSSEGVPLLILAGKEYGSGSSRDWAAKGVALLGVRAVIAESFERIHRTNLVGMGVLPLQFPEGENAQSLGLTGKEVYHVEGVRNALTAGPRTVTVRAVGAGGKEKRFEAVVRVDTPQEVEYFRNGGILPYVLRQLAANVAHV